MTSAAKSNAVVEALVDYLRDCKAASWRNAWPLVERQLIEAYGEAAVDS
jgi:hypothetical protein